jgi:DNA-binding transcriptional regulator YiaG
MALNEALEKLDWDGNDLARRLGLHQNTVSLWSSGKRPVPGYAEEYLRVMVLAKEILDG